MYVYTIAHRDVVSMHLKQGTEETRQLYECGLFFQPLVSLFKKFGSRNASLEASVLHNICTNGIITDTDLLGMGYQTDPICKSCSASLDTVIHRCYTCPAIEARARQALGDNHFDRIIAQGPNLFTTRLLAPAPVMLATRLMTSNFVPLT